MTKRNAQELLERYRAGNCSEEEKTVLRNWFHHMNEDEATELTDEVLLSGQEKMWDFISEKTKQPVRLWPRIAVAAMILTTLSVAVYFYNEYRSTQSEQTFAANQILPGGNKAVLTLGDGRKITLDDAANGELLLQSGIKISKTADGQLVYTILKEETEVSPGQSASFNTIETPRGGQYQVNLSDGTTVWLNSASSLKYQTVFSGNERKVELRGEGYFEVAHQSGKPFIVKTNHQQIAVLGTHFNVNAYEDEQAVKTTLLEGSVRVERSVVSAGKKTGFIYLKPGQQSVLTERAIDIQEVDTKSVIDWKDGRFIFKEEDIKSVMRKLARWYDFEVVYQGNLEGLHFGGKVSRSKSLKDALKVLTLTGDVHFKVEGRRITVMP
ncbi:FecR protein [Pedobacter steynii]|uniref:FecR protein n=1 Tax=Pedobacter steynii TaxID=430522 RepID=A0A1G9N5C4_9SPHI|nr:FecR family protein [Pedobacter steynii]NQX39405.1 FecR domain-containing protein [Pedobacter steynii]SDL81670.1 FecR protein [Pedobacter steynii]